MAWPDNSAFSAKLPTLQLAWDSTSLGDLKKCPRYYELRMVHGWSSRTRSVHLDFGIWLHSARERYYHARAGGANHESALDTALQYVLTATWDQTLDRPWHSGDKYKNRLTLAQTLVDYCDKWKDDPLQTVILSNGKPAVEVSFRFGLGFGPTTSVPYDPQIDAGGDDEEFLLCGHLDRIVSFQERVWGSDLKTTQHSVDSHYFSQFSPDNQMSVYSLAGRVVLKEKLAGMIIDACQVLVTEPPRFARALVERTEQQLAEFARGLHVLLRQAEQYARANFWPQNEKACFRCEFRPICSRAPSVREQWLKADFTKRTWDPLKVRGDI